MVSLALCLLVFVPLVRSWTVTSYFEQRITTDEGFTSESITRPAAVATETVLVTPTVEHPTAVKTITTAHPLKTAIGYEKLFLEPGQGRRLTRGRQDKLTDYNYYIVFAFTKPSDCTYTYVAPAVTTTTATVYLPQGIDNALTPTSTTIYSTSVDDSYEGLQKPQTIVDAGVYLDPERVPPQILNSSRNLVYPIAYRQCDMHAYNGDGNFSMCEDFHWGLDYSPIGGGYRCSNGTFHTWGLKPWSVAVIVVLSWVGFFSFCSIIQVLLRFRKLMLGLPVRRGLPTGCCYIVPVLCLPALAFNRRGFATRSEDDRETLRRQWSDMPLRTKIRLFLRYGFTNEYPPILGSPPVRQVQNPRPRRRTAASRRPADEYELSPPPPAYSRPGSPPKYSQAEDR